MLTVCDDDDDVDEYEYFWARKQKGTKQKIVLYFFFSVMCNNSFHLSLCSAEVFDCEHRFQRTMCCAVSTPLLIAYALRIGLRYALQ